MDFYLLSAFQDLSASQMPSWGGRPQLNVLRVGGRMQEESCLSHDAQQLLNARQTSTDWEVSSETQMCEKERESEGESHTCSYLFSVYKNFYGLGGGPWMSLEKAYSPAMLCLQDLFRLKWCENHWLLLQCNHTLTEKWSIFLGLSVRRRGRFSSLWDTFCCEVMGHHFSLE